MEKINTTCQRVEIQILFCVYRYLRFRESKHPQVKWRCDDFHSPLTRTRVGSIWLYSYECLSVSHVTQIQIFRRAKNRVLSSTKTDIKAQNLFCLNVHVYVFGALNLYIHENRCKPLNYFILVYSINYFILHTDCMYILLLLIIFYLRHTHFLGCGGGKGLNS